MANNKAKKKMDEMIETHLDIISEMIESQARKTHGMANNGIKDRRGRGAHEFRINGVPYWVIMAG